MLLHPCILIHIQLLQLQLQLVLQLVALLALELVSAPKLVVLLAKHCHLRMHNCCTSCSSIRSLDPAR